MMMPINVAISDKTTFVRLPEQILVDDSPK